MAKNCAADDTTFSVVKFLDLSKRYINSCDRTHTT